MLVIAQGRPDITEFALDQDVNGINAAMAFSTDSLIQEFDLVILEDTLTTQPVFQPTAVFRGDVLKANPDVMNILNPIFDSLDNETLQAINAEIDVKGRDYREVAEEYLRENGFIASN